MGLFSKKKQLPRVAAVVVAAGGGERMQGIDKQQLELCDMPVIARSISCMESCPGVSEIVLVCREADMAAFWDIVRFYGFGKVSSVVTGGAQRQDSVFAGVSACGENTEYFAIHDGARPLTLPGDVQRCLALAFETGAAAVGVPVTDTIKICDENSAIVSTPNRDNLWAVQTPQVFEAKLYRRAMAQAIHERRYYTDDCQLVERAGHKVYISRGSYGNIKITTPEDAAVAEAVILYREGQ